MPVSTRSRKEPLEKGLEGGRAKKAKKEEVVQKHKTEEEHAEWEKFVCDGIKDEIYRASEFARRARPASWQAMVAARNPDDYVNPERDNKPFTDTEALRIVSSGIDIEPMCWGSDDYFFTEKENHDDFIMVRCEGHEAPIKITKKMAVMACSAWDFERSEPLWQDTYVARGDASAVSYVAELAAVNKGQICMGMWY